MFCKTRSQSKWIFSRKNNHLVVACSINNFSQEPFYMLPLADK